MTLADEPTTTLAEASRPRPGLREFTALVLSVALADATIYRGGGYGGWGVLLAVLPLLLALGAPRWQASRAPWIALGMLLLLAVRSIWLGSALVGVVGTALIAAFAMAWHKGTLHVWDIPVFALQTLPAGFAGLCDYGRVSRRAVPTVPRLFWINVLLPTAALAAFGAIFVMANPDLAQSVKATLRDLLRWPDYWSSVVADHLPEVVFCGAAAWLCVGLARPIAWRSLTDALPSSPNDKQLPPAELPLYLAVRNMLWAVNGLFVVYLIFEFRTLWFREFPPGFYYAGYAHEGAGWLTAALALATLVLSVIFHQRLPRDARATTLRRLAWVWSGLNLVLALSVYNRMHVYIDFNGMTRTIGLFGISTVVAGFLLVVVKIAQQRGFAWLVSRQLGALAIAVYLYALMPVDMLVHSYNVRQIMQGDLAPAVQITEHPISAEGVLMLAPLLRCEDDVIRDGVRALHAEWAQREDELQLRRAPQGWTSFQAGDALLRRHLEAHRADWEPYRDAHRRRAAWDAFRIYAYQWY